MRERRANRLVIDEFIFILLNRRFFAFSFYSKRLRGNHAVPVGKLFPLFTLISHLKHLHKENNGDDYKLNYKKQTQNAVSVFKAPALPPDVSKSILYEKQVKSFLRYAVFNLVVELLCINDRNLSLFGKEVNAEGYREEIKNGKGQNEDRRFFKEFNYEPYSRKDCNVDPNEGFHFLLSEAILLSQNESSGFLYFFVELFKKFRFHYFLPNREINPGRGRFSVGCNSILPETPSAFSVEVA